LAGEALISKKPFRVSFRSPVSNAEAQLTDKNPPGIDGKAFPACPSRGLELFAPITIYN
jgi:hypothetical protein